MEAIRKFVDARQLKPIIELPESMKDSMVELIILSVPQDYPVKSQSSMKGYLKKYANPVLVEQEKHAWEMAVSEKYGNT